MIMIINFIGEQEASSPVFDWNYSFLPIFHISSSGVFGFIFYNFNPFISVEIVTGSVI
jgi:hypothetical protein